MSEQDNDLETWWRSGRVADELHVSPKTVSRWAKEGKLPFRKTLGGHRKFNPVVIREMAAELEVAA